MSYIIQLIVNYIGDTPMWKTYTSDTWFYINDQKDFIKKTWNIYWYIWNYIFICWTGYEFQSTTYSIR